MVLRYTRAKRARELRYKKLVYTLPDLLARFSQTCRTQKKSGPICFPIICFRGLIYCDQEPLWLLNVIEDVCYFLGVHVGYQIDVRNNLAFPSNVT